MAIADNISRLKREIPGSVKIVAVSKTMSIKAINEVYQTGHKVFGENKVQELVSKHPCLPEDIEWHFIGHLQTNKVRIVAPLANLIHSVDSEKLLKIIDKEGSKLGKKINCLLQLKIAREATKYGMDPVEAVKLCRAYAHGQFKHVIIKGLMGMATFTDDELQIEKEFTTLSGYYKELKKSVFLNDLSFTELSMGMSADFKIAVHAGATIIRIGSLIFGEREY